MKTAAINQAAMDLDDYVRFRAIKQGVGYELSEDFFRHALRTGCRGFFNITVAKDGRLVRDDEYPEWFEEWRSEAAESAA
jgi:hypothetical protein